VFLVTRQNVNQLLASNGFSGEIDLLSLDMEGVDHWISDAIQAVTPRSAPSSPKVPRQPKNDSALASLRTSAGFTSWNLSCA
jgi:hypothetical protein